MSELQRQRVKEIFLEAIERPSIERQAYLQHACDGDAQLLAEVVKLLDQIDDDASGILATPPVATGVAEQLRDSLKAATDGPLRAGEQLGPYTIGARIGQGGMSVVYRATQTLPIKRDVAIKVLKRGMDSEAFLRRFDLERRVLSSMEHPNIATVLDAGVSPEGQPYFVMELVRGPGLIEYCDKRELGVRQRIEIFLQVCRAVHHAHMRAVIHRDLKPSNVLVTEHDGVALPKVIDFGVAKAIHLPIEGGHTWHGESVGTPAYMSPEHWNPEVDIDIRADVYSLGLVLFELLSGRFPYPFETVNARDVHAVRTAMERSEPTRMSTLVGEGRDSPSPVGGITGSELAQLLRGDLDAVLLMAVAKDRDQRYQSVDAFADDLNRFLTHRPTHARPPGLLHSVRMFCHRHQTLSAASALIAIGVAAAIGATGYHFARIDREFNRTKEALIRSEVAEGDATARAQELQLVMEFQSAQIGRATPERMGDYLRAHIIEAARAEDQHLIRDAFKHINFTDVGLMSLREGLFEPTGSAIDIQFVDQPIIKAQLLESLGNTLHQVGLIDAASEAIARTVEIRREHLGDKHLDTLRAVDRLGSIRRVQGRFDEAEVLLREALKGRQRIVGEAHPDTVSSLNNMGLLLANSGRLREAVPYFDRAIRRYRASSDSSPEKLLTVLDNAGQNFARLGLPAEAEALLREALEERQRMLGSDHPDTLRSMNNLGAVLVKSGRGDEAEQLYRDALEGRRRVLGDHHLDTMSSVHNMAFFLAQRGQLDEARLHYQQVLDAFVATERTDQVGYLVALSNMGNLLRSTGDLTEAELYHRRSVAGYQRVLGDTHPSTVTAMHNLGVLLESRRDFNEAAALYTAVMTASRVELGNDHPDTLVTMDRLAKVYMELDNPQASEPLAREYMVAMTRVQPDSMQAIESQTDLAKVLAALGRHHEAEAMLVKAYEAIPVGTADTREGQLKAVIEELLVRSYNE